MLLLDYLSSVQPLGPSRIKIQPLSPALKDHLMITLKGKSLVKSEYLLQAGQISRHVCFIESGLLRCYYISETGKEVNRWFMREGDVVFSISSFYEQIPGQEYIQALEPTQLYYITYEELDEIYINFPEFERIGRHLTIKYHLLWDKQLASVLTKTARERFLWLVSHHDELFRRVADKHLASWLGITEVRFSQMKAER